jgi:5-methylcytosine-specific restriction protein A
VRAGSFADRSRGTRHQRGYGAAWSRIRERIMRRDGGLCQPSLRHGYLISASAVDHIVSKAAGGTDDDSNLQAISHEVHLAKTAAERLGRWDEAAYFARLRQTRTGAPGEGGSKVQGAAQGTDRSVGFSCAQVLEGGG